MEQSIFWIALSFGVHIAMVNLGIFLAVFVPYLKYKADKTGDKGLDSVAYKLMKFYAATYALAGVYGTAYTVFLLSFYPDFIGLAGHLTLVPFGIAVILIGVHFFAITSYYYGWNRWGRRTHHIIGLLLAVSSILIPLGFRAVFAFLNIPVGLKVYDDGIKLDVLEALTGNPTFLPLYLKSIVGAVSAGSLVVLGGLSVSYARTGNNAYRLGVRYVMRQLAPLAVTGLTLMPVLGLWYALSLRGAPYKFNNIFAELGWRTADGVAYYSVSWLFILKMALYAFQVLVVLAAYRKLRAGVVEGASIKALLYAGIAGLITIVAGEYLNAFSQYPCFVAALASGRGCSAPPGLPEALGEVLDLRSYNVLVTIKPVVAMTVMFMAFLTLATVYFFYVLLVKEERG